MNLHQHLEQLQQSWNYEEALELYATHQPNAMKLFTLQTGESSFNTKVLQKELEALKAHLDKSSAPKAEKQVSNVGSGWLDYTTAPQELIALNKQRLTDQDQLKKLHFTLAEEQPEEDRRQTAMKILELETNIQKALQEVRYYRKHGSRMPQPVVVKEDFSGYSVSELSRMRENRRTSIAKAPRQLQKWEAQIEALKETGKPDPKALQKLENAINRKKEKVALLKAERLAIQSIIEEKEADESVV